MKLQFRLQLSEVELALLAAGAVLVAGFRYQAYKYLVKNVEAEEPGRNRYRHN